MLSTEPSENRPEITEIAESTEASQSSDSCVIEGEHTAQENTGLIKTFQGLASIPPTDKESVELIIRTPKETSVLMLMLLGSVILFSMFYWDWFGVINKKLVFVLNGLLLLGTVDYFQKVYVFKSDSIARRTLFLWTKADLPEVFTVRKESSGAVVFFDEESESVIMSVSQHLATPGMLKKLRKMYRISTRSTFEIG